MQIAPRENLNVKRQRPAGVLCLRARRTVSTSPGTHVESKAAQGLSPHKKENQNGDPATPPLRSTSSTVRIHGTRRVHNLPLRRNARNGFTKDARLRSRTRRGGFVPFKKKSRIKVRVRLQDCHAIRRASFALARTVTAPPDALPATCARAGRALPCRLPRQNRGSRRNRPAARVA